jgi:hypothetical protein
MRRLVQIRHRRKQGKLGCNPPLRLESPVAVAEQHRTVTGEPVRSYNIRHAIAVNNARLMPDPGPSVICRADTTTPETASTTDF